MSIDAAGLTPQQAKLLRFIASYVEENGASPSLDEMTAAIGLASKSGAHRLLEGLEKRGRIRKLPRGARSVVLIRPADIAIFVNDFDRVHVDLASHISDAWVLRHGDQLVEALNARLAQVGGHAKLGRAA